MDIARSIQVVTEEIILRLCRSVHREIGMDLLCLAGGVALNCVANGQILREAPYKDLWIQPTAGDAGGSVGAALSVWHEYLGKLRRPNSADTISWASCFM
jgi:carbamoyltransferase